MDKVKSIISKIFSNTDKIIKGIAIFAFIVCIIGSIGYFLYSLGCYYKYEDHYRTISLVLLISSIFSFFIYGFGEIITQLKEINHTSYWIYMNSVENKTKEN